MAGQAVKMAEKDDKMPEKVDNETEPTYDIEGIVGYRRKKGKMEFLVKWAGYSYKENSWEGLKNLQPAIIWVVDYLEDQDMMPLLDEVYTFYGIVEKAPKKDKNQKKESKKTTKEDTDQDVKGSKAKNNKTAKNVDVTMAKKDKNSKKTREDDSNNDVKNGTAKIEDQKTAKSVDMATGKAEKQKAVKYLKKAEKKTTKKEDPIYFVEGIASHRRRYNKLQFFIKWAGFDESENTWESLENLRTAKIFVYNYLESFNLNALIKEVKDFYGDV